MKLLTDYYLIVFSQFLTKKNSVAVYEKLWNLWKDVDYYRGY